MIINQVIELEQGNYQIKADLTRDEAVYLFGVAFTTLLVTGGVAFAQSVLGDRGTVTTLPNASKDKH